MLSRIAEALYWIGRYIERAEDTSRLLDVPLALPAYEMVLKAGHSFTLVDARGAILVTERAAYIGRVRTLSRGVAQAYYNAREALGFPMLKQDSAE